MALNKAGLITALTNAFQAAEDTPGAGNAALATAIGNAIDTYTKTATVSVTVTTPDTISGTGSGTLS